MGQPNTNKTVKGAIGLFLFVAIVVFVVPELTSDKGSKEIDGELVKAASKWNITYAPLLIADDIYIDNHIALIEKKVQGSISFMSMAKDEVDDALLNQQKATLVHLIKTDSLMSTFREKRVTITYFCKDMNGSYICDIKITPDMYN